MKKILVVLTLALLLVSLSAQAKLDISGKIYSQYRFTNSTGDAYWSSDSFGSFSSGSSIWPGFGRDDKKYANFLRSEAELEFNATVSKYVKAYMRMKTVFNSDESNGDGEHSASSWSDDWDNSRGFLKLRGFLIQVNPDNPVIKVIELGTPMGYPFNKWLLSDRRYIDRDNIKGILVRGQELGSFSFNAANIWNASYMGPGWNGVNSFRSEDYTEALNLRYNMNDQLILDFNSVLFYDKGYDTTEDGNIKAKLDFYDLGISLDGKYNITDEMSVDGTIIFTKQTYDDAMDVNDDNVADNLSWVTQQTPAHWYGINEPYADVTTFSGIFTFNSTDPFGIGLSPKAQFFYLDDNLYTPFGSRREQDMLMIHGGIDALRFTDAADTGEGARQHQSLNTFLYGGGQSSVNEAMTDNCFLRLGQDFYESPIGYSGLTLDGDMDIDIFTINGQFNYLMRTDNNDGKIDEKDENYDGDDVTNPWYYEKPRDFSAIVGDGSIKTTLAGNKLGFTAKFGNWQDVKGIYDSNNQATGTYNIEATAQVLEFSFQRQLTQKIALELKPRYQVVEFSEEGIDNMSNSFDNTYSNKDIILAHKWIYNFGGFDFWLRGEHFLKRTFEHPTNDDLEMKWYTIHAAFEVKF